MTSTARLEQDLTIWLSETAMPRTPDYADEILDEVAHIRQRPRWTFLRRWLPVPEIAWNAPVGRRTALGGVLLLVLALLLAAVAIFVGSRRPPMPPPFGLAANGLLVSSHDGDIVLVDPDTLTARTIVAGIYSDEHPRWSLDGTRLAFLRQTGSGQAIVIADDSGRILAITDEFANPDSDSVRWSPDSRQIAVVANGAPGRAIYLVDVATGLTRKLKSRYVDGEIFWRPPDGGQLLAKAGNYGERLGLVSTADGGIADVPTGSFDGHVLRALGMTPDGRRALFQDDMAERPQTIVVDVETGADIHLDVAYGHLSNDGTRVAGIDVTDDSGGRLCIVPITGGSCNPIDQPVAVEGAHGAALSWSPDDRWLALLGDTVWLVDPDGIVPPREVAADGPGSWQRLAP